jgi:uncharacterized protein (DUF1800 family)
VIRKTCSWLLFVAALSLPAVPGFSQTTELTAREAARFLDQATWGPTPPTVAALRQTTLDKWLSAQFALNTSTLPAQPILDSAGNSNNNLAPVQAAFFRNALMGQDQLRQRVAFALSQIWVVSAVSGVSPAYAYPAYWQIFQENAFGNYRDIIQAVTLSPAMGRYLNMANNDKSNTAAGTAPNENYARELMQLFTLGLTELNSDGTPVLDASKNPVPTYTQSVVTSMAKVFTGWTYPTAPAATAKTNNPAYYSGQMFAVDSEHDKTAKAIFGGIAIPAGGTGPTDLTALLDAFMKQPTMAPFVSQQLIQHLVTSNPSAAYIKRVSTVFQNNGSGVTGDLKAVITAILTDPEARAGDSASAVPNPNFGHLREPVLFMANILRGLNGTITAANTIAGNASGLGEDLFNEPSVFSYFSPQYRTEKGLLGPEFQIYSTQTVTDRADIVNTVLYGSLGSGAQADLTPFIEFAGNTTNLLNYIGSVFLHDGMSAALTTAATGAVNAATTPTAKAQAALYVVLTSGEYQIVQ